MESYLHENFGVKSKYSSDEALQRWKDLCVVVKNPKQRFRLAANLSQRNEVAAMSRTNLEKFRIAVHVSKAALRFRQGAAHGDHVVPKEVKAAGFNIDADGLGSIVEGHELEESRIADLVSEAASLFRQGATPGDYDVPATLLKRNEVAAMCRTDQEKSRIADLVAEAASPFMQGATPGDYDVHGFVKKPKWRFWFPANLSKRNKAATMYHTDQEKLRIAVLFSKAAFQLNYFI